jgi:hypothetical protein
MRIAKKLQHALEAAALERDRIEIAAVNRLLSIALPRKRATQAPRRRRSAAMRRARR